jgi:hypothetical protein
MTDPSTPKTALDEATAGPGLFKAAAKLLQKFAPPLPDEPPEIEQLFESIFRGDDRFPVYPDNRRVPLEIFQHPLRLLLLSEDPRARKIVTGHRRFRDGADILFRSFTDTDDDLDVKPARWKPWHDTRLARKIFPPLERNPTYYYLSPDGLTQECPPELTLFLRACRSGRQPIFTDAAQLEPEIFDHPFALHILSDPEDPRRTLPRDRWKRAVRGRTITYKTERTQLLAGYLTTIPPEFAARFGLGFFIHAPARPE